MISQNTNAIQKKEMATSIVHRTSISRLNRERTNRFHSAGGLAVKFCRSTTMFGRWFEFAALSFANSRNESSMFLARKSRVRSRNDASGLEADFRAGYR
jgi:hypothetical protein